MKILHVYKTFLNDTFGGIEQAIFQIAQANQPHIHHTILSLTKNNDTPNKQYQYNEVISAGIKNICYKLNFSIASTSFSFSLLRDFKKITQTADIIHYHFPWPFADFLHLFWQIKKPSIVTYHSDIVRQQKLLYFYRPLMSLFLNKMDTIIATSPNYLATSPVLQKYKNKVAIIPVGLNRNNYPTPDREQYLYWQTRFKSRFFLFIGVMRYYKGLHILLSALQNAPFPAVIVGAGPLEDELKAQAKKLNLTNVHFLGQVAEKDKIVLLELCLAVLFPSHLRAEAFGISLLEGAMAGKPLISSEIGTGTSYINIHGETGLVVPPGDPLALRNAMQFIWEHPQEAAVMGKNAALRYQELFTGEKMVTEYEKIYQKSRVDSTS